MIEKSNIKNKIIILFHKFSRFTKQQKVFVLYLFTLTFFLVLFPLIKVSPVDGDTYRVRLLSGSLFKIMVVSIVILLILIGWNVSFRFKNIIINYFGFKENEALVNFSLLCILATALWGIGDTINVIQDITSTISVTGMYYFIQLLILGGLVLTLLSVLKAAKAHGGKAKIINMVNEDAFKEVNHKKSFKGLFEEEDDEILASHHTRHEKHHTHGKVNEIIHADEE